MARINEFLSHIDFEAMREYCIANGETVPSISPPQKSSYQVIMNNE